VVPRLISRDEALARIRAEGGTPACLMCAIVARQVGPVIAVHEDERALVMLPRYVRRWGHMLIVPKAHVVTYTEVPTELWGWIDRLALHAARVIERLHRPPRCYVASTGSAAGVELTQTSRHLHAHVIPLEGAQDRPADVFSWAPGVLVAEPPEWEALRLQVTAVWQELGAP
jgi:histidine triad (HIT) family protein